MRVREVADRLLAELAPLDAEAAQALGTAPESIMPKLAPADFAARSSARKRALRSLDAAEPATGGDRVLADALGERLASEISLDECGFTTSLLAPLATPVHEVRQVFDALPRVTSEDWSRIAAHLHLVPRALGEYADTLRDSADRGHVVSRRQVLGAAQQCEAWISTDDYYRRLAASAPGDHRLLDEAAEQASVATAEFVAFLRTELLPRARETVGVGREVYSLTARAFLGDEVDLADTYAFGWEELARITGDMQRLAGTLGAATIDEAAAALDADPAGRLDPPRLLDWLRTRVEETVTAVDGVHFDLPPVARVPECHISDASAAVMYYAPPDPAFTRAGRIVWTPGETTHTWREVTTVHHEGVPGHHLQIVTALAEPGLHPWQRAMANVHGYAEGWAHYAERLSGELGLLRTPAERLGMLFGQRWRAARIVIDMGLHLDLPIPAGNGVTDSSRWTPEVAVAFLRAASGAQERTARYEVERYFGWPAQALAFRIGSRLWQQIREQAQHRPGFDLRSFHMAALRLGPMGLGPLRRALLA